VPVSAPDLTNVVERNGFAIVSDMLVQTEIELLRAVASAGTTLARAGQAYGGRNLLNVPEVRNLAANRGILDLVAPMVAAHPIPVRALFFDKTPGANWPVLWHQDLTIAVRARHDLPGWGPWSVKAGVPHVEPPAALLTGMLTIRLHLDDCGPANGPLRVCPGTHALGRLSRERIRSLRDTIPETVCIAPSGSALLMRPLLLHASSPAIHPSHRRVLHIEYADPNVLPPPLAWAHTAEIAVPN
jgi:hypothetical protein